MNDLSFKIAFMILWLLYIIIRIPHDKNYKLLDKKIKVRISFEKKMTFFLMLAILILPLFWVFTSWLNPFNIELLIVIRIIGVLTACLSLWLFWSVHKTLGLNWSPFLEIRKEHQLIKTGLYKTIRHPMYLQIWLWVLAQLLIISNWVVGSFGILVWAIIYFIRVPKEEKMMIEEFGNEYRVYMNTTNRIFPKLFKKSN